MEDFGLILGARKYRLGQLEMVPIEIRLSTLCALENEFTLIFYGFSAPKKYGKRNGEGNHIGAMEHQIQKVYRFCSTLGSI